MPRPSQPSTTQAPSPGTKAANPALKKSFPVSHASVKTNESMSDSSSGRKKWRRRRRRRGAKNWPVLRQNTGRFRWMSWGSTCRSMSRFCRIKCIGSRRRGRIGTLRIFDRIRWSRQFWKQNSLKRPNNSTTIKSSWSMSCPNRRQSSESTGSNRTDKKSMNFISRRFPRRTGL
jgi:hypothetical protein